MVFCNFKFAIKITLSSLKLSDNIRLHAMPSSKMSLLAYFVKSNSTVNLVKETGGRNYNICINLHILYISYMKIKINFRKKNLLQLKVFYIVECYQFLSLFLQIGKWQIMLKNKLKKI